MALLVSATAAVCLGGASVGMSTSELLCGQALVVTAFATRFVLGRMWAAVGVENNSREPKPKPKQE